jgi:hypothetical protein
MEEGKTAKTGHRESSHFQIKSRTMCETQEGHFNTHKIYVVTAIPKRASATLCKQGNKQSVVYVMSWYKDSSRKIPLTQTKQKQLCANHQVQLHPLCVQTIWYIRAPFSCYLK